MERRNFILRTAAATVASLSTVRQANATVGGTILLGQSVALSGPFGELGNEYRAGAQLWFNKLNTGGGVHGRQIKLLSLDDGYDPGRAIANTRRLVEKENVFAFFGQFGTDITRASLPLTIHQGIPVFAPYTGADSLREYGNRYLFHVRASYGQELRHMVGHLVTMGVKDVGIVYQDDGFGQAALHGAVTALQRQKMQPNVVSAMAIAPAVDVAGAVKVISLKQPTIIIMCTSGKGAVAFIKKYRETNVATQFYGMSEVSSRELAADLGLASRGVVITQVVPSPWSRLVPVSMEYQRLRDKQRPLSAGYGSLEGFIAAKVFSEGLKRVGMDLTRESLVTELETINDFDVGGFRVSYGPENRIGSNFVDLSMLSHNGEFVR